MDFGNFKNVLKDGTKEMSVGFDIKDAEVDIRRGVLFHHRGGNIHCEFTIQSLNDKEEFFSSIMIVSSMYKLQCKFNNILVDELIVDDITSKQFPQEQLFELGTNSIFPKIIFASESMDYSPAAQAECETLMPVANNPSSIERSFLLSIDSKKKAITTLQKVGISKEGAERYYNLQIYSRANEIIDAINRYIFELAGRVFYTKPIRALGERFYRYRNVEVGRVDPSGENIAMFLSNLIPDRLKNLNKFLSDEFGFSVEIRGEGNLEILINTKDGQRNLVDVGVGYTQLLPILITVWDVKTASLKTKHMMSSKMDIPYFIMIEQPELHLHPKLQYDFAKVVAKIVCLCQEKKIDLRIVIETHSEYIINKIGEMIAQEQLDKDFVAVLLFNRSNSGTEISKSVFSSDGYLTNWPYGFFDEA